MKKKVDHDDVLKRIKEGDSNAYRLLFNTYFNVLCIYATSLTKCIDGAKDIVQNVLLDLWVKRERITVDTSLNNYLYRSVYHSFLNDYKQKNREKKLLDQLYNEALQELIVEEENHIQEKLVKLHRTIEELPSKSKEIFIMNKKDGLTHKEISQIMNISKNTVESHISRALKRLRLQLAPPSIWEDF